MNIKNAITLLVVVIILIGIMTHISNIIQEETKQSDYGYEHPHLMTIDSLNKEIFIIQSQLGKYEITLELLKEQDIKAADKFENIFSNQTE